MYAQYMVYPIFTLVKELRHKINNVLFQRACLTELQVSAIKCRKNTMSVRESFTEVRLIENGGRLLVTV